MPAKQLALDLGHRPALGRADLHVTAGNQEAVAWIDRWPEWPGHALGLYGPEGSGKSHLVHVFAARSEARVIDGPDTAGIDPVALAEDHKAVAIDRADGTVDETWLFHVFNAVREAGGSLLIASRDAPARWAVALPDLQSRLKAMPAVEIHLPDDATLAAVLAKLFRDRQVSISDDVVEYAVTRMPRTFAASLSLVDTLDREALAQGRKITVPLVRDALASFDGASES